MTPIKRNILLNPGPATTTDSVKYAQVVPDICPREQEFGEVMFDICKRLAAFVGSIDDYHTVLFGGAGTAGIEAMLTSVVTDKVLIIDNGAYGKRMRQICERYGMTCVAFESSPIDPLDMAALDVFIQQEKPSHLAVVHHETTSGLLNDIAAIGALCHRHGVLHLVDAMSSYGAIPIDMAQAHIDVLVSSSNKNIQGMAGIAFVIAKRKVLDQLAHIPARSFYLDLYSQYDHFQRTKQTRFTPPVQTLYALQQAIRETEEEGIPQRYARYSQSWDTLIKGLDDLNLNHYVDAAHHSRIITSIQEPEHPNYDFDTMCNVMKEQGFTIYPGKLSRLNTFRISNIGDITHHDITAFIQALTHYLKSL